MAIEYFKTPTRRIKNDGESQGGVYMEHHYLAADTSGAKDRDGVGPEDEKQRPITEMNIEVHGGRFIPTFSEREHWEGGSFSDFDAIARQTGLHPEYVQQTQYEGADISPSTLFIQEPKEIKVNRMFSDPSMPQSTALNLAAMAMNDYHVGKLTPSDDLSQYSSRLVKSAKKLGVIEDNEYNPDADVRNDIEKEPQSVGVSKWSSDDYYTEQGRGVGATLHKVPQRDVLLAQQKVRKIVRGRSSQGSPKISSQFDTPLPGMEGFV